MAQNHVKIAWLDSNCRLILRLYKRVTISSDHIFSEQNELKGKHCQCQILLMVLTDALLMYLLYHFSKRQRWLFTCFFLHFVQSFTNRIRCSGRFSNPLEYWDKAIQLTEQAYKSLQKYYLTYILTVIINVRK